jgi:hypothetical protein
VTLKLGLNKMVQAHVLGTSIFGGFTWVLDQAQHVACADIDV